MRSHTRRSFSFVLCLGLAGGLCACEQETTPQGRTGAAPLAERRPEGHRPYVPNERTVAAAGYAFSAPADLIARTLAFDELRWLDARSGKAEAVAAMGGVWHGANETLTIAASGAWRLTDGDGRTLSGTTRFDEGLLTFDIEPTGGGKPARRLFERARVGVDAQRLALVPSGEPASHRVYARTKPRTEQLELVSGTGTRKRFRLAYDAKGRFLSGVYGGSGCRLLSCGGWVAAVEELPGERRLWTRCSGGCPCSGRVTLKRAGATTYEGSYVTSNCERVGAGSVTASTSGK